VEAEAKRIGKMMHLDTCVENTRDEMQICIQCQKRPTTGSKETCVENTRDEMQIFPEGLFGAKLMSRQELFKTKIFISIYTEY
jgi:recombinational DNA repair protein RecR